MIYMIIGLTIATIGVFYAFHILTNDKQIKTN
jgi:hypothetical protein